MPVENSCPIDRIRVSPGVHREAGAAMGIRPILQTGAGDN